MPNISFLSWLQSHEWVFWLAVNLSAYLSHWWLRYTFVGILAVLLPFAAGAVTVILASELWLGGIGIGFILLASIPVLVVVLRDNENIKPYDDRPNLGRR